MKNLEKLTKVFTNLLGKKELKVEEGKLVFENGERDKLEKTFSKNFIDKFAEAYETNLAKSEGDASEEDVVEAVSAAMQALREDNDKELKKFSDQANDAMQKYDAEHEKNKKLEAEKIQLEKEKKELEENNEKLNASVRILSAQPEDDQAEKVNSETKKNDAPVFKIDRNAFHNKMAAEARQGDTSKAILAMNNEFNFNPKINAASNTINTSELAEEFGAYMSQFKIRLETLKLLTQQTVSQKYMTVKLAIDTWKASKTAITSVVQQFVAKWTPLGSSTFTPIEIRNRRHKINVPITPDDITNSWLAYLYQENLSPEQMPITKYVIEQLLRPKIEDDIELLLIAKGEFEELAGNVSDGDAGQATGKSMDGFVTTLKKQAIDAQTAMNFFTSETYPDGPTENNIVAYFEEYADWAEETLPLYVNKGLDIYTDPKFAKWYSRKYREMYPTTKNEDGSNNMVDDSNFKIVPLPSMRGTNTFFSTPKENFIALRHINEASSATKLFLQTENYTVKVFGEFWLATGFALGELVLAYVPETSGSASGGA